MGNNMADSTDAGLFAPTVTGAAETIFIEALWPEVFDEEISLSKLNYHTGCARFDEVLFIASIARYVNPEFVFEIGTCEGRTTINIARNCPRLAKLFTLNLPPNAVPNTEWLSQDKVIHEQSRCRIGINFKNSPYKEKIEQIFADSDGYPFEKHAPLDLVLIDGGTRCDTVFAGSQKCWDIMRAGGVLVWRAYNYADGVTLGVDSFCKKNGIKAFSIYKTTLAVALKS
jgi:predicted O-methyltransferase YrrM